MYPYLQRTNRVRYTLSSSDSLPWSTNPRVATYLTDQGTSAGSADSQWDAAFPTGRMLPTTTLVLSALSVLTGRVSAAPSLFSAFGHREASFLLHRADLSVLKL